jgi:hypothetical protein
MPVRVLRIDQSQSGASQDGYPHYYSPTFGPPAYHQMGDPPGQQSNRQSMEAELHDGSDRCDKRQSGHQQWSPFQPHATEDVFLETDLAI